MGEIDSDAKDGVNPPNELLPSQSTMNEQTAFNTSLFSAPSPMQIQNCTPGSPIESIDKAPQECETTISTPAEHNDGNTLELSSEPPEILNIPLVTSEAEILDPGGTLSDLSEPDEDVEVPELSQSPSDQPMIAPQLVLSFLNETYRQ